MFARVYPIVRLPRRFGVFDYAIPEGLPIAAGDLLRVPFHRRSVLAVVAEVADTTNVQTALSEVESVVTASWLSDTEIARLVRLSADIAQSPSSMLAYLLGQMTDDKTDPRWQPLPRTSLGFHRDVVTVVGEALRKLAEHKSVAVQTSVEGMCLLAQKMRERTAGQLLILSPLERDAERIAACVPLGERVAVLHGKTTPKARNRILHAWHDGRIRTLIGTRQASLIPPHDLSAVLLHATGNDEYFNDRRNPRFDVRNAAFLLAEAHGADRVSCDVLPRPEDALAHATLHMGPLAEVDVVDCKIPEEINDAAFLSHTLQEAAKTALQSGKKVLLFFNRKGVAKRAQCRACQVILTCHACHAPWTAGENNQLRCPRCMATAPLPDACPHCTHGRVALRGIGNVHIEESLTKLFPGVSIARIEKGRLVANAQILLVTEFYFSSVHVPFARKEFGLVADLAVDMSQRIDDFRSAEWTARKLHRLAAIAKQQGARCIVQTWLPEQIEAMRDGATFLAEEQRVRLSYGLPPGKAQFTVRHASPEAITALTGIPFVPNVELLGCEGRVDYAQLDDILARLSPLPDTAIISIDRHYGTSRSPHAES